MVVKITEREKELIELLITGKTNKELARDMIVSIHTIKSILENLYRKFDVHNRMQLAIKYLEQVKMNKK